MKRRCVTLLNQSYDGVYFVRLVQTKFSSWYNHYITSVLYSADPSAIQRNSIWIADLWNCSHFDCLNEHVKLSTITVMSLVERYPSWCRHQSASGTFRGGSSILTITDSTHITFLVITAAAIIVGCHLVVVKTATTVSAAKAWYIPGEYSTDAVRQTPEVDGDSTTRIAVIGRFSSCGDGEDNHDPGMTKLSVQAAVAASGGGSQNYVTVDSCAVVDALTLFAQAETVNQSSFSTVVGLDLNWLCDSPSQLFYRVSDVFGWKQK